MKKLVLVTLGFMMMVIPSLSAAMEEFPPLLGQAAGPHKTSISYKVQWHPRQDLDQQDTTLDLVEHSFSFSTPIFQKPGDALGVSFKLRLLDIQTEAVWPDTGGEVPERLWIGGVSANYQHHLSNGWMTGINFGWSLSGDKAILADGQDRFGGTYFLTIPSNKKNMWFFYLNYDTGREFLNRVPLPGVAYLHQTSEKVKLLIGLPFFGLEWKISDDIRMQLIYFPLRNINLNLRYTFNKRMAVDLSAAWKSDRYFRADRLEDEDRIIFYDKTISLSWNVTVVEGLTLQVNGGYAFDRFFFEGRNWEDRHFNRLDLQNGFFFGAGFSFRL